MRRVRPVARRKGGGHGGGVVGLLWPRLGALAEQCREPGSRILRRDRRVAGRWWGRALLPLAKALPHAQARGAAPRAGLGRRQGGEYRRTPRPACMFGGLGDNAG